VTLGATIQLDAIHADIRTNISAVKRHCRSLLLHCWTDEALIILSNPTYLPHPYHSTLLIIAVAAFSVFINTFLAKNLPLVEAIQLLIHICGFFAILIPLWTLAPRDNARGVFSTFNNGGGWNSEGISTLVGLLTSVISLTGSDSVAHVCMSFLLNVIAKIHPTNAT
jgi:amino acid transporter